MAESARGSALLKALRERRLRRQQEQEDSVTETSSTAPSTALAATATPLSRTALLEKLAKRKKPQVLTSSSTSTFETAPEVLLEGLTVDEEAPHPPNEPSTTVSPTKPVPKGIESKRSRPPLVCDPVVKKGSSGVPLELSTNSIRLKLSANAQGLWEYHVSFQPELDKREHRYACINSHKNVLGSVKMFRDHKLILPKKLESEDTVLQCIDVQVGQDIVNCTMTVSMLWRKPLEDPDCVLLYNIQLSKVFTCPQLQMCSLQKAPGKKRTQANSHFDPKRKQTLEKHGLEIWPGYVSVVGSFEGGVHLQIDTVSKVLRTKTCLETIKDCFKKSGPSGYKEAAIRALVGATVITRYNNRTYKIDDIDFNASPSDEFTDEKGIPSTFMEYYLSRYGLTITDTNQPMLVHLLNRPELQEPIRICFVPELCFPVGMSDQQTSDFRVMKDVAEITRLPPVRRLSSIRQLVETLRSSPEAKAKLSEWGLEVCPDVVTVKARKLDPVTLHFGGGAKEAVGGRGDWGRAATTKPVLDHRVMDKWAILYQSRDEKVAKSFCESLKQQCPKMGIQVRPPKTVPLAQDKTEHYLKAIRELPDNGQLVVIIFGGNQRADRYAAVKKLCCGEKPIASQVLLQKTLSNEKRLQSVVQKVALQINCKLGGALWGISIPIQGLMVIGIDCYKDGSGSGGGLVTGVVSSVNATFSQYYSNVFFHSSKTDCYQAQIDKCVQQSMDKYKDANGGRDPISIVVFRDGVRGASDYQSLSKEGESLKATIQGICPTATVTYVLVERAGGATKFFARDPKSGKTDNPPGGAIIDSEVTLRDWYDFYLVPMNVSQGTVNPTHFVVVYDDSKLTPDTVQKMSYALTHMYFNWTGVIKVPAPCQYSRKLAQLVGDHTHKEPNQVLKSTLFYL